MSKVLFTGATGLLGKYFFLQKPSNFDLYGTYIKNLKVDNDNLFTLDVSSEDDVNALFEKIMPDFVVHAAALGNVDYCETHKDEARKVFSPNLN
jgi:dTDP-4-dehydrorhamnose reductase